MFLKLKAKIIRLLIPLGLATFYSLSTQALIVIVTDVDDTIRMSDVEHKLSFFKNQFLGQVPFTHLLDLYRNIQVTAEQQGEKVIFFYLTGAPKFFNTDNWLKTHQVPPGVLLVKPYSNLFQSTDEFKYQQLRKLLKEQHEQVAQTGEPLKVLLFGDNGQYDADVYSKVLNKVNNPQKNSTDAQVDIKAFIRRVIHGKKDLENINYFISEKDLVTHQELKPYLSPEFSKKIDEAHLYDLVPSYIRKNLDWSDQVEYESCQEKR